MNAAEATLKEALKDIAGQVVWPDPTAPNGLGEPMIDVDPEIWSSAVAHALAERLARVPAITHHKALTAAGEWVTVASQYFDRGHFNGSVAASHLAIAYTRIAETAP